MRSVSNLFNSSDKSFRRYTGITKHTYKTMLKVLIDAYKEKHKQGGRPASLPVGTMLIMSLEYWREYSTYLYIGINYDVSESTSYKIIRWVEDTLIRSGKFSLPGKKALTDPNSEFEVILVDASEVRIERPKKNSVSFSRARKNLIHLRRKLSSTKRRLTLSA